MTAYYNEIEPYAVAWLRQLIKEGRIADGEVDTRSIVDVRSSDLDGFDQCHFFAGLGGWSGALRLAGVGDDHSLWTGSCPCQPFSLAGKQKGFADDRHLWPVWRELIRERSPAKVYGEQVASAAQWLRLVRSDLEALGYAVGAIPMEAASAGADHLRDRYWFVANEQRERIPHDRSGETSGAASSLQGDGEKRERVWPDARQRRDLEPVADADDEGPQGRRLLSERAGERLAGPDGMADTDQPCSREEREQRSGQQRGASGDQETCDWVIGADGKARRVKSGVRLLAHGIPNRVAKLRTFGNAIDLRPAAAFIKATI